MKTIKTFLLLIFIFLIASCNKEKTNSELLGYKNDLFWSKRKASHVLLNRILSDRANVLWSNGNHTATPVPLGAVGPAKYIKRLNGMYQNTNIAKVLKDAVKENMNVILVIGDGMGINQMSFPIYENVAKRSKEKTYFEKIMNEGATGLVLTNPHNSIVTGSAASGTAFACGSKTLIGMLGLDYEGKRLTSILDVAQSKGKSTGLITEANITDATPAAFYAHQIRRGEQAAIAKELIMENNIDVIFGGGGYFFIPKGTKFSENKEFADINSELDAKSKRKDDLDLIKEAKGKNYTIINTKKELLKLDNKTEKVLGVFSARGINAVIDRDDEQTGEPSLVEMADKGIKILSKNKKGFFLMIEAARIDWESHDNDAGSVYKAAKEMNKVLKVCYDFYSKNKKKTIIVFTADHETGGLGISYTRYKNGKRIETPFSNGKKHSTTLNTLPFEEYLKIGQQKKSVYKIFSKVKSKEELYKELNNAFNFEITKEDAEIIFNSINNYRKSK